MALEGSDGEVGLGLKGVVEATFIDASLGADVVDTDRAVTALPDEVDGDSQKLLFGITFRFHKSNVVDWSV